ncbi:MAG: LLM class F420-dependent oxidoreductase [Candidatus Rokuibacteriota bacterium]
MYGAAATRATLLELARRAEALDYDSLWVSDHVVLPWRIDSRYPYNASGDFPLPPATDFLEPLTALSLVAAVTERVALGTSVMVLPHRHPVLAAKMLATLDHLAPGRVILGAGVGWMREEIELFGVPYGRRGAWSDEAIQIMRACWTQEHVRFKGEFFTIDDVACRPRPAHGTIPIWIGGHTERALRRVVALADGWHAAFPTPEAMADGMTLLNEECARVHRDPGTLTVSARMGLSAKRPAAELIEEIHALRRIGVHHVIVEPAVRNLATMTATIDRFAQEVRAKL